MASRSWWRSITTIPAPEAGGGHLVGDGAWLFHPAGAGIFTGGGADKPGLFGHTHYQGLVRPVALVQMGIARANFLLALMKGFRDAAGNAFSLIAGSLIGVAAYYACYVLGGYQGALLGLALVPALVVVPAGIMLWRRGNIPLSALRPRWDNGLAGQLSKFTLMALITSVTLPVAYVMMRNLLAAHYGWEAVGIWQGLAASPMPTCSLLPPRLASICCRRCRG